MEKELLYKLQNEFPLVDKPFKKIAEDLNTSEENIISTIQKLKDEGIIRQTSAIFDTKKLGYQSSLVAFKVKDENIDKAVDEINSHPGVSHNYLRNHSFNIWFTLAVPPDSKLGLEQTVKELAKRSEAQEYIILPTLKMFKIAVKLDTTGKRAKKEKISKKDYKELQMKAKHFAVIRELQKDIPIVSEPFKESAEKLGMSYDEIFSLANEMKEAGIMRRFATILNHRKAGFTANAMSVWSVPEEKAEELGKKMAEFSSVSHCYLRPKYPNWPYNLFAMVHAKTQEECDEIIDEIAKETQLSEYGKLYSTKEFKKRRLVYFDPSFQEWEEKILGN